MNKRAERDACRVVEVDGEPVLVRGSGEMDDEDRKFFAEVVRAVRAKAERMNTHTPTFDNPPNPRHTRPTHLQRPQNPPAAT